MATPDTSTPQHRGNPAGTRFAIITLAILLALVGIYFLTSHVSELDKSPVVQSDATQTDPARAVSQ